jgi:hypothetical protein
MRVARSVLVFIALAIHLTGCGKGPSQASSLTIQLPEQAQMWRWQVVKAGSPDEIVQSVTDGARTVTVSPGNYQVTIQPDQHFSGRLVWPQTIRVKRNQKAAVSIQSGITLQVPENTPLWRWQVVQANAPDKVVQWATSGLNTLLIPPGDYQLIIQQDQYFSGPVVWPQTVPVAPNQPSLVALESGIALQLPENTPLWRWQVVQANAPDKVVQWATSGLNTLLIPPGDYQLIIQQDQYFSGRLVWPTPVHVEKDQPAVADLQSGVKLSVRAKSKIWRWQVVQAGAPDEVVQWTTSAARTLLVPPGEYQIIVQPDQYKPGTVVWPQTESLVVSDGQIAPATLDLLAANNTEASGSAAP